MPRPPFGSEPERSTCRHCDEVVMIPPGVYYRGEPYHKHCAVRLRKEDISEDLVAPRFDRIKEEYDELMSNMKSMSEG